MFRNTPKINWCKEKINDILVLYISSACLPYIADHKLIERRKALSLALTAERITHSTDNTIKR